MFMAEMESIAPGQDYPNLAGYSVISLNHSTSTAMVLAAPVAFDQADSKDLRKEIKVPDIAGQHACVDGGFRHLADRPEVGSLLFGLTTLRASSTMSASPPRFPTTPVRI